MDIQNKSRIQNINSINLDVLAHILTFCLPPIQEAFDIEPLRTDAAPLNVMHVCWTWREIVLSTPKMWSQLYFNAERGDAYYKRWVDYWKTALDRSKECRLDIFLSINESFTYIYDESDFYVELLDAIDRIFTREIHRWGIVHLNLSVSLTPFRHLLTDDGQNSSVLLLPPCIEELTARSIYDIWQSTEIDETDVNLELHLDITTCSRIRRLHWGDACSRILYDDRRQYSSLTFLHLGERTCQQPEDYLGLLRSTPNLEELEGSFAVALEMPGLPNSDGNSSQELRNHSIILNQLRNIHLYVPYTRRIGGLMGLVTLFTFLVAPTLDGLHIETCENPGGEYEDDDNDAQVVFGETLYRMLQRSKSPLQFINLRTKVPEKTLLKILRMSAGLKYVTLEGKSITQETIDVLSFETSLDLPILPCLERLYVLASSLTDVDSVARMLVFRSKTRVNDVSSLRQIDDPLVEAGARLGFQRLEAVSFIKSVGMSYLVDREDIQILKERGLVLGCW